MPLEDRFLGSDLFTSVAHYLGYKVACPLKLVTRLCFKSGILQMCVSSRLSCGVFERVTMPIIISTVVLFEHALP